MCQYDLDIKELVNSDGEDSFGQSRALAMRTVEI